jgi:hypothetical protein
MEKELKKA